MNAITVDKFGQEYELACKELLALEREAKALDKKRKEAKAAICKAMEENGIKAFENEILKLTYVAPTETVGLDTKAFQMGDPDAFEEALDKYPKETRRSAYVKVTPK